MIRVFGTHVVQVLSVVPPNQKNDIVQVHIRTGL